ncbi:MAG TPA: hypothetical protein VM554_11600 [Acidisarcina sp.]|nr:hypothetical protein [Acidisarcina sp.]
MAVFDESFPRTWQVDVLPNQPLIAPARAFVYPHDAEEADSGALQLLIHPARGSAFLATCALGFADSSVPTGIWTSPNPDQICAVAGGYAYLIQTLDPGTFEQIEFRPVLLVQALPEHNLLLFGGHHSLLAYGPQGRAWHSPRLSWEGIEINEISGNILRGTGWDLMTDSNVEFAVDLRTGEKI